MLSLESEILRHLLPAKCRDQGLFRGYNLGGKILRSGHKFEADRLEVTIGIEDINGQLGKHGEVKRRELAVVVNHRLEAEPVLSGYLVFEQQRSIALALVVSSRPASRPSQSTSRQAGCHPDLSGSSNRGQHQIRVSSQCITLGAPSSGMGRRRNGTGRPAGGPWRSGWHGG